MAMHHMMTELERRPNWALRRAKYITAEVSAAWCSQVEEVFTSDPVRGLPMARTAIRLTRRLGDRCHRVRALCLLGYGQRVFGELEHSRRCFSFAFGVAGDCTCSVCRPTLNRQYALTLTEFAETSRDPALREEYAALALHSAEVACEASAARDDSEGTGRSLLCRGTILLDTFGRVDEALRDLKEAHHLIPAENLPLRAVLRHNYVDALAKSGERGKLLEAAELMPEIRAGFRGLRGAALEIAKTDWTEGNISAGLAALERGNTWNRRILRSKARQLFMDALEYFEEHGMHLEATALQTDLAALEAAESRERAARLLDRSDRAPAALRPLMKRAARAARRGPVGQMWTAMRALRDATVVRGADPPLVAYGAATG